MYKWGCTIFSRQVYVGAHLNPMSYSSNSTWSGPAVRGTTPPSLLQWPLDRRDPEAGCRGTDWNSLTVVVLIHRPIWTFPPYSTYIRQQEAQINQDYTTDHENNKIMIKTFSSGTFFLWTAHTHWYKVEEVYSCLSAELIFIWLQTAQTPRGWMSGWEVE